MRPPSTTPPFRRSSQSQLPAKITLFTRLYDSVVRTKDDPPAPVFLLGFDSAPIRAEKSLYDLATWTRSHQELAEWLLALPPQKFLDHGGRHQTIRCGMSGTPASRSTSHVRTSWSTTLTS